MINNDILRRYQFALSLSRKDSIDVFSKAGLSVTSDKLDALLKKEEEEGFQLCSDYELTCFLDGVLYVRRGRQPDAKNPDPDCFLDNNLILRKMRIALEMKENDMLEILKLADFKMSGSELRALFRNRDHQNYRICGDQVLRKFLSGLTLRLPKNI